MEPHVLFMLIAMSLLDHRPQISRVYGWTVGATMSIVRRRGEMAVLITPSQHVMNIGPLGHIVDQCDGRWSVVSTTSVRNV